MQPQYSIVAFSHLRWNFVYQRPQHLLSRLAAKRRVFFVEEPEFDPSGSLRWERSEPQSNLVVLRPRTPIQTLGFDAEQLPALEPLSREAGASPQRALLPEQRRCSPLSRGARRGATRRCRSRGSGPAPASAVGILWCDRRA